MAFPSWEAPEMISFYFIFPEDREITRNMEEQCAQWIEMLPNDSVHGVCEGFVTRYSGLSAWEYLQTAPLDLDHLSER